MLKKCLILFCMSVSQALPWGAVNYWSPTHQAILTEAYKFLSQDPWYSNGSGIWAAHVVGTSSHVLWEKAAHEKYLLCSYPGIVSSGTGRYNSAWKNALPNFYFNTSVTKMQSKQSAQFAHKVALYTRKNIQKIHTNPTMGIYQAIRNVATLWRSSITGLRPSIRDR